MESLSNNFNSMTNTFSECAKMPCMKSVLYIIGLIVVFVLVYSLYVSIQQHRLMLKYNVMNDADHFFHGIERVEEDVFDRRAGNN